MICSILFYFEWVRPAENSNFPMIATGQNSIILECLMQILYRKMFVFCKFCSLTAIDVEFQDFGPITT